MSWSAVDAIDARLDPVLGGAAGNPVADGLAYGASALGDHGLVWFLIGVARGRKAGPGRGRAAWAVTFSGVVTPLVNEALKRSVRRTRPVPDESDPRPVRVPRSASFPSGHALAAWCAATTLATDDPLGPLYYAVAGIVSVSRVHLRQHHPTDVLAGAVLGIGLGRLGRYLGAGPPPAPVRARNGGRSRGVGESMSTPPFGVTFDYRCPFARNVHEHLVTAMEGGADWDVEFLPFSLTQSHIEEGEEPVWSRADKGADLIATEAGLIVRDRFPDRFPAVHMALFAVRHDQGRDLRDEAVIGQVLKENGVDPNEVFAAIEDGWPRHAFRVAHEAAVNDHQVFGVPTFIAGDASAFVRIMTRPDGDASLARVTIEHVLELLVIHPEINEFKHTSIAR